MAAYGYSYVDILAYYYPGAVLTDSDGSTILSNADLSVTGILKTVTGSANPNVTQWGTVNEDDTNFRLESNTDCDSSARLLKGTPLGIYKKSGDWYFCMNLDTGVQGWVYASYVTLTAGPTATASPTATPTPAATASPVPAPTLSTVQPTLRGDINGDGVVGSADASMALRYSVKLEYLNEYQLLVADVNNDGKVSASDASRILRYVVKLIDIL